MANPSLKAYQHVQMGNIDALKERPFIIYFYNTRRDEAVSRYEYFFDSATFTAVTTGTDGGTVDNNESFVVRGPSTYFNFDDITGIYRPRTSSTNSLRRIATGGAAGGGILTTITPMSIPTDGYIRIKARASVSVAATYVLTDSAAETLTFTAQTLATGANLTTLKVSDGTDSGSFDFTDIVSLTTTGSVAANIDILSLETSDSLAGFIGEKRGVLVRCPVDYEESFERDIADIPCGNTVTGTTATGFSGEITISSSEISFETLALSQGSTLKNTLLAFPLSIGEKTITSNQIVLGASYSTYTNQQFDLRIGEIPLSDAVDATNIASNQFHWNAATQTLTFSSANEGKSVGINTIVEAFYTNFDEKALALSEYGQAIKFHKNADGSFFAKILEKVQIVNVTMSMEDYGAQPEMTIRVLENTRKGKVATNVLL